MRTIVSLGIILFSFSACSQKPAEVAYYGDQFFGKTAYIVEPTAYDANRGGSRMDRHTLSREVVEQAADVTMNAPAPAVVESRTLEAPVMAAPLTDTPAADAPAPIAVPKKVSSSVISPHTSRREVAVASGPLAQRQSHGDYHVVNKGDTLFSIARAYDLDVHRLMQLNRLSDKSTVHIGQRIRLHDAVAVETPIASPQPQPEEEAIIKTAASDKGFQWPLKGPIISRFGPKQGGLRNDGINIGAKEGDPIRAAKNGTVVYAGDKLKGYGNLVIIRHSDGWLTAYAHTERMRVRRGDDVQRGQVIAYVGKSGNVDQPQLHFAVRKKNETVDPLQVL